ncbi:Hypothetical protein SCLAV_1822 [Streptomyces clavuligerus]|uniref:Uncharacterized protein n=1 Tax=Streptomyces clavuligerus TaxID=1901 RepID=E2Q3S7_STRCL|nr:Hypothetical protein SCLAV_1822 [Streptomyces clavuligerus]
MGRVPSGVRGTRHGSRAVQGPPGSPRSVASRPFRRGRVPFMTNHWCCVRGKRCTGNEM